MVTDPNWLAQTDEAPIEPELPIIDPHHHFWDYPRWRYLLDELLEDTAELNVRQTVFVECGAMYRAEGPTEVKPLGETEFAQGLAAQSASGHFGELRAAAAIVGHADLRLGDAVSAVLESHLQTSPRRFRGIRHHASWDASPDVPNSRIEPGPGILADSTFREGFARLRFYGLSYEAWCYHPQIPEVTDLARAFPDTTLILNHLGTPLGVGPYAGQADAVFDRWRDDITELATCPNVVAKVGGIQMPINGFGWDQRAVPPTSDELLEVNRRWYLHTIEQFGPDRCMFESNFPVDKRSCSYTVLWNQFKKLSQDFAPDERAAMFHDTALRVYRLAPR
jgi:L-fuconolactonase